MFRKIQSSDGRNLTHNFRPVQPLDGRIVYRNIPTSMISGTSVAPTDSEQMTNSSKKPEQSEDSHEDNHNGQQSMWTISRLYHFLGLQFILIIQY